MTENRWIPLWFLSNLLYLPPRNDVWRPWPFHQNTMVTNIFQKVSGPFWNHTELAVSVHPAHTALTSTLGLWWHHRFQQIIQGGTITYILQISQDISWTFCKSSFRSWLNRSKLKSSKRYKKSKAGSFREAEYRILIRIIWTWLCKELTLVEGPDRGENFKETHKRWVLPLKQSYKQLRLNWVYPHTSSAVSLVNRRFIVTLNVERRPCGGIALSLNLKALTVKTKDYKDTNVSLRIRTKHSMYARNLLRFWHLNSLTAIGNHTVAFGYCLYESRS